MQTQKWTSQIKWTIRYNWIQTDTVRDVVCFDTLCIIVEYKINNNLKGTTDYTAVG